jgi:hypothetical protein
MKDVCHTNPLGEDLSTVWHRGGELAAEDADEDAE